MVVILGDGTIVADDDPRARLRRARTHLPDTRLKLAVTVVALAAAYSFVFAPGSEAANGKVPAMAPAPGDHWYHLYRSPFLMRDLSKASAHQDHSFLGRVKHLFRPKDTTHMDKTGRESDYGGADGAAFETFNIDDPDSHLGTLCASTKFALSVYFCGAATANGESNIWNGWAGASQQLRETLESMRMLSMRDGPEKNVHSAFVYELGLGQMERSDPPLEHVWTVVAQPDGKYMWLQSYIGHYTLQQWMKESLRRGEQYLTYEQLISKLDKYDELRAAAATGWTSRANTLYQELFYVDVLRARGAVDFTAENAIKDLGWQIRCKYPTSSTPPPPDPGVRYEESRGFGGVVRRR